MNEISFESLTEAIGLGEDAEWEFKSARGGIPGSLWESYSAMANTDGGVIVLGVEQKEGHFILSGISDHAKTRKEIWDALNNRGKVSINLLTEPDVAVKYLNGKYILVIRVPRASRRQRPVFVGQNPLTGTFRRNFEGDYNCSPDEVGRMLADRAEEPADSRILEHYGLADFDITSINQYRNRFSATTPDHPWLKEDTIPFLEKLGGFRRDRVTGVQGVTVAGMLMFGKDELIRGPDVLPAFQLDYRERPADGSTVRWTDRLTLDGTWAGNVYQFFERVILKLTSDLKIPFQLTPDLFRTGETVVHEAIREALVNAIIHADYRGQGGIIIEKYPDRLEMSNPGTLLISMEQILKGGVSECRNKSLQLMFQMIGRGEKAGSGVDKIRQGWKSQHWRLPGIKEQVQPDRVKLMMPMVSILPQETLDRLHMVFGRRFSSLEENEVQALVTADVEGQVSNSRMQEIIDDHPADITKMLQGLVHKNFLKPEGIGRGTRYSLAKKPDTFEPQADSTHKGGNSTHNDVDSTRKTPVFEKEGQAKDSWDSSQALDTLPADEYAKLKDTAAPAVDKRRLLPYHMRKIIADLCSNRFLTVGHLAELLKRNPLGLQERYLRPMVSEGLLVLKYPDKPNRPDQAYRVKKAGVSQ